MCLSRSLESHLGSSYSASLALNIFARPPPDAGFHLRTGAECNPGACYGFLGVEEEEIEALAGEKEGCDDDIEFIQRPIPAEGPPKVSACVVVVGSCFWVAGFRFSVIGWW